METVSVWRQLQADLQTFRCYQQNWDGRGADAPDPAMIDVAIGYLGDLQQQQPADPPTSVSLSPDATEISFSWHSKTNLVRAEIGAGRLVKWMRLRQGAEPEFWKEQNGTAYARS